MKLVYKHRFQELGVAIAVSGIILAILHLFIYPSDTNSLLFSGYLRLGAITAFLFHWGIVVLGPVFWGLFFYRSLLAAALLLIALFGVASREFFSPSISCLLARFSIVVWFELDYTPPLKLHLAEDSRGGNSTTISCGLRGVCRSPAVDLAS